MIQLKLLGDYDLSGTILREYYKIHIGVIYHGNVFLKKPYLFIIKSYLNYSLIRYIDQKNNIVQIPVRLNFICEIRKSNSIINLGIAYFYFKNIKKGNIE